MSSEHTDFELFIKNQVERWKQIRTVEKKAEKQISVVTISSEPGSGGQLVAREVAKKLSFDLFERDIVKKIAESVHISDTVIHTMEKKRLSGIEDFLSSLVNDRYLWPGLYLEHLMKVIGVIGKHGRAVIVGRGANFIIPPDEALRVRLVAPLDVRVRNIAKAFEISPQAAKKRVMNRESNRRAFCRQSFNANLADPCNYDLVINTHWISIDTAVQTICAALESSNG